MSAPAVASAGSFITTATVNLRTGPTTESTSIRLVNNGTSVEILDHNPAGWSRVTVGGTTGFIRSDFLKFPTGGTAATFKTTAGVNVRESGSIDSRVVTTVAKGSNVEVTEHNPAGWSKVRANGINGFIRSDFLTRGGDGSASGGTSAEAPPPADTVIATLSTTGVVNFRIGPSTSHNIIRTLTPNTSVEVTGTGQGLQGDWSRVRHNGTTGFIRSDLLSETGVPSISPPQLVALRTTGHVNLRSGPSTSNSIIRTLAPNTNVEVTGTQGDWSRVSHNGTNGFIKSNLLVAQDTAPPSVETPAETPPATTPAAPPPPPPPPPPVTVIATLKTVTGVFFRIGPSTDYDSIRLLPVNTVVEVTENLANGWSAARHEGTSGFIKSEFLTALTNDSVELVDWSVATGIVPTGVNLNIVDVRTGITFQLRGFAKSGHLDVEPPTQADTDAIFRTRNSVWSWAARPVWVTVGDRTFAAALNGMPHDVSTIHTNGMNGHLCLHFNNTVTNSQSYQRDLRAAVMEAYNARPR